MGNPWGSKLITNTKRSKIVLKHKMQMKMVKYSRWKMKQLYKCETIRIKIKRKYITSYLLFSDAITETNFSEILDNSKSVLILKQINRDNIKNIKNSVTHTYNILHYRYIKMNHFAIYRKLTQHCK